jgi:hypothetical protein
MKRWFQSRIYWSEIIGSVLAVLPFALDLIDLLVTTPQDKALWVIAVKMINTILTLHFRNQTDTAIGSAQDVAAHEVLMAAFDEKNSGA